MIWNVFQSFTMTDLCPLQRHPAATPASYPQVQAPIVNNPAFWERLGMEPYGADSLFFTFYYQQVLKHSSLHLHFALLYKEHFFLFLFVYLK